MSEAVDESFLSSVDHGERIVFGLGVADVANDLRRFGLLDYLVFATMLFSCVLIGIYFGYFRNATSTQEYLVGGRSMKTIPVALSLVATFVSGISLLGIPTEIYVYGVQYLYIFVAIVLMALVFQMVYLPVFHDMRLTSTYEYLEKRFDKTIRIFASVLFLIAVSTWLPVVMYVPALALNQVTGVNVHFITPCVCVICMFYTTVGGLRAVVWADVLQTFVMVTALLLIIIKGTINVGGFQQVWQRNLDSERLELPNFELNLWSRHTIWALTIGGFVYWLQQASINQNMMQRYLSLPNLKAAKRALWLFVFGIIVLTFLCGYSGMLIYATYHQCDPLTTKLAREKDQLLPLLVMDILGDYPGLPGLFMAGIFSAALSSLSTAMNASAAVVLEDFCKTLFGKDFSERYANILMKVTVILTGSLCVGLVLVVETLGAVLQLTMSIATIAGGPSLGLITMGVLLPWVNSKGALIGGLSGLGFMGWLLLKAQTAIASGDLFFPEKNVSTEGCHYDFTPKDAPLVHLRLEPVLNNTDIVHADETFMLHKLSYLWYTLIGSFITISVGLMVSFLTRPTNPKDLDSKLLAPFLRKYFINSGYMNQPLSCNVTTKNGSPEGC